MAYGIRNYGIPDLRQQQIFDNFPSMNYMDEQQSEFDAVPPPMETTAPFDPRLMGRQAQIGQVPQVQDNANEQLEDMMGAINRIYSPQTRASDRFNEHLDHAPVRQEPTLGQKLVAMGVGLGNVRRGIPGGLGEQEKVLSAPYIREMMDWNAKNTPFSQAAQQENTGNVNERTLAGNAVTSLAAGRRADQQAQTAYDRNQTTLRGIESKERIAAAKRELDRELDDDNVQEIVKDGDRIAVFYKDGTHEVTEIPGSAISDRALARLNGELAKERNDSRNATQERIQGMPARSDSGGDSPSQAKVRRENAIQQVYDEHEEWRDWIDIDNFQILDAPGGSGIFSGTSGETKRQHDMMKAEIKRLESAPTRATTPTTPTTPRVTGSANVLPGNNVKADEGIPVSRGTADPSDPAMRAKARAFLQQANLMVTEANITHAIRTGRVK